MIGNWLALWGIKVIAALAILIVGWLAAGWVKGVVAKLLGKSGKVDATLIGFLSSLAKYAVLVFTVVAVLAQFGVQTASIIAVLGALGLAVGLALQGTLSHIASGVMLLLFRPFKVGDFVDAGGISGTVKAITLFTTELATGDNVQILVPNGKVWGQAIRNFSFHDTRRCDLLIGISYDDDIEKAISAVKAVIGKDERVLKDPEAMVAVAELGESSVDLTIRMWCEKADYWALKFDMNKALKEALEKGGFSIPYPQTDVHIVEAPANDAPAARKPAAKAPGSKKSAPSS